MQDSVGRGRATPREPVGRGAEDAAVGDLRDRFRRRFAAEPRVFRAPGRLNLIGEHTDYNDGLVLPMAIERAVLVAVAPRADRAVHAVSTSELQEVRVELDRPGIPRRGEWSDYLEGVVRTLRAAGRRLAGADLYVASSVPRGGGLSSSAALEVALAQALLAISGESMSVQRLAQACQTAEHDWVGTHCGIMDQLTVLCAEADHALSIDCRDLRTERVPLDLDEVALLITDSTVSHRLASSEYNQRRRECEAAVRSLQKSTPGMRALRDVGLADLPAAIAALPEPLGARVRHVVTENARVEAAIGALLARNWTGLGELMSRSHASLRDNFQVSTPELDLLVDTAMSCAGVRGARMTGAGFGGCILTLARRDALPTVEERLDEALFDVFGLRPRSFQSRAAAGAGEVSAAVAAAR